jgi:hypothetical protein
MDQFRTDNTEGYTDAELHNLNCEFERRAVSADDDDHEHRQRIAEGVLRDYDSGHLVFASMF